MNNTSKLITGIIIIVSITGVLQAQTADLKLVDWRPVSQMKVKETKIVKAKFPVIDVHNHLGKLENTEKYLEEMDKAGVWKCVSLDANSKNDFYKEHIRVSHTISKDRFLLFFRPDFSKIDESNFGENEVKRLEEAVKMGCRGLKISKRLGLGEIKKVDSLEIIWPSGIRQVLSDLPSNQNILIQEGEN